MMIEFGQANSGDALQEVAHLRRQAYQQHENPVVEKELHHDEILDRDGLVFLLREGGDPVATMRISRLGKGLTKTEKLPELPRHFNNRYTCEISRLCWWSPPNIVRKTDGSSILILTAQWLLRYTDIRYFVAHCRKTLYERYSLLGAETLAGPITIGDSGHPYFLIQADLHMADLLGRRMLPLDQCMPLATDPGTAKSHYA